MEFSKTYILELNSAKDFYSAQRGYGLWKPEFCEGDTDKHMTDSESALKSGGWNNRRLKDIALSELQKSDPEHFVHILKFTVPEFGTYKATLTITKGSKPIENMTVFAGRRNIISQGISVENGEYTDSFYVAVTPYIPALTDKRCMDKDIFISLSGKGLADNTIKVQIEREDVPVMWIAGDSTLTDQNAGIPYYPYGSCAGWAQTVSRFVRKAAVCNLAHSGLTSNCFRDDGHYDIAKEMMKKGDLFVIQFGHNDQKRRNLAAAGGYADNLRSYVREVREKGVVPVICSPISRIPISDGHGTYSLLKSYADACAKVAEEENVTFIDLHEYTYNKWIQVKENAKDYFIKGDITHTNEFGAVLIGNYFAAKLRNKVSEKESDEPNNYDFLNLIDGELLNAAKAYGDKFIPDNYEKELPKEVPGPNVFEIEPPYGDIDKNDTDLKNAFKYGLLDPCVMHLHPDAIMPRAQLLMVMLKAFRMSGCRPYLGKFADVHVDEWDSGFVQALINNDLIDKATIKKGEDGREYFRPDDALTYEEFASFIIRFMGEKNLTCVQCLERAKKLGIICIHDKKGPDNYVLASGNYMSRSEVYGSLARLMDIVGGATSDLPSDAEVHPVH